MGDMTPATEHGVRRAHRPREETLHHYLWRPRGTEPWQRLTTHLPSAELARIYLMGRHNLQAVEVVRDA